MTAHPGLLGRLYALMRGEQSAETLEGYRRGGNVVYDLLDRVEGQRLSLKIDRINPWVVDEAKQLRFLCTWNAFALQTLGDRFLDADYKEVPLTAGFVPPVTARQVLAFYDQVAGWLARAEQVNRDPAYRPDVALPAELPAWAEAEPCPRAHLEGMLEAARTIRAHAEAALAHFEAEVVPDEHRAAADRLRGFFAEANAKLEYASHLWGPDVTRDLHGRIEEHAKAALERYYQLGQALAMPGLEPRLGSPSVGSSASRPERSGHRSAPGEPGFDPWCLTDRGTLARWQGDPKAHKAIDALWANDPDPRRTLEIQAEIGAALERGEVEVMKTLGGEPFGCYFCCPWASIYEVKRPTTVAGKRLRVLEQFTYDVSAEEIGEGGAFKREIMVGSFRHTDDVDYCNPDEVGHDG